MAETARLAIEKKSKSEVNIHFRSNSHDWETPIHVFRRLHEEFGFTLDAAATKHSAKCKRFYTVEDNALVQNWHPHIVFLNPPYGRIIGDFISKSYEESLMGSTVVCLIPARTCTRYWHRYIFPCASEIRFIEGRICFGLRVGRRLTFPNSAPFPAAVVVFRGNGGPPLLKTCKF